MAKPTHAKPGCFCDFFQLLFCAENGNTSQMHPFSDPITKPYASETVHGHNSDDAMVNATKPGVVARLMGLDSLPSTNLVSNANIPDSVPRSRSVNFVDYLLKFDTSQNNNHHQVKTSASFREVPAPFQHKSKSHDLVVFYWDSGSEDHEIEPLSRIQEMGLEESRNRKKQGSKNKEIVGVAEERNLIKRRQFSKFENEPRVVPLGSKVRNRNQAKALAPVSGSGRKGGSSSGPSGLRTTSTLPNKQKKVPSEPKRLKNTRKQEKIESEFSSENSSAISVLDDYDFSFLYGPDFPGLSLNNTLVLAFQVKLESKKIRFILLML